MAFILNPTSGNPDVLRIVSYPYRGASPITLLDLNDEVNYTVVADTFEAQPAERTQQFSSSGRRYSGAKLVNEVKGNAKIVAEWYVKGNSASIAIQKMEAIAKQVESTESQRYVAWQPSGASQPTFYPIMAGEACILQYRWITFQAIKVLHVRAVIQVAPLAEGLPMYVHDRFQLDSSADYTITTGLGTAGDWVISNGVLTHPVNSNLQQQIIHTDRGYTYGDCEGLVRFKIGATTPTAFRVGVVLKYIDANNYIRAWFHQTGADAFVKVDTMLGGVLTNRIAQSGSITIQPGGSTRVFRGRIEKNRVYTALYADDTTQDGEAPLQDGAYNLNSSEAAALGRGVYGGHGMYFILAASDAEIREYEFRPFVYREGTPTIFLPLPGNVPLDGPIPGTAPAKADVEITPSEGSGYTPAWAAISIIPQPPPWNMIANGDFRVNTVGWNTIAVTGQHAAATSITRSTTVYDAGGAGAVIAVPATATAGAHYKIYRRFRRGVTYTYKVRAYTSAADAMVAGLGFDGTNKATEASGSAATWQTLTGTWTPTADVDYAYVYVNHTAASATNINVDSVQVYEGTVAPSISSQIEGRGAQPPFGPIKAMTRDASSGFSAITEGVNDIYLSNSSLTSFASAEWLIDPALLPPDPFSDDVLLEFWGRISVNFAAVKVILAVLPETGGVGNARYTNEWGSVGKRIGPAGSGGSDFRIIRLGTISLPVSKQEPIRHRLLLTVTPIGLGVTCDFALHEFYAMPVARRCLGPTGKPNDNYYPDFMPSQFAVKRITHDLSGFVREQGRRSGGWYPDSGLGGEFIEPLPGNNRMFVALHPGIPDDDASYGWGGSYPSLAQVRLDVTPRYNIARDV